MDTENDPTLNPAERQLAARLRADFERAASDTDAVARARLAAARRRALRASPYTAASARPR